MNGTLVLPYLAGERIPIMDPDARGVLVGLTLTHTRGEVVRRSTSVSGSPPVAWTHRGRRLYCGDHGTCLRGSRASRWRCGPSRQKPL